MVNSVYPPYALTANDLNTRTVAEGVETEAEFLALVKLGITKFQGYYLAKPGFKSLPDVDIAMVIAALATLAR